MFVLNSSELQNWRRQFGTSNSERKGLRYAPMAFTEHGILMLLSSILKSKRVVDVNIEIMRAFLRLRRMLASNAELSRRVDELEKTYNNQFKIVFEAIRTLMAPAPTKRKEIRFRPISRQRKR